MFSRNRTTLRGGREEKNEILSPKPTTISHAMNLTESRSVYFSGVWVKSNNSGYLIFATFAKLCSVTIFNFGQTIDFSPIDSYNEVGPGLKQKHWSVITHGDECWVASPKRWIRNRMVNLTPLEANLIRIRFKSSPTRVFVSEQGWNEEKKCKTELPWTSLEANLIRIRFKSSPTRVFASE